MTTMIEINGAYDVETRAAASAQRARVNFGHLMEHVARLYCLDGSSSVSMLEAYELTRSVLYTLGIGDATAEEAVRVLDVGDPVALWNEKLKELDVRTHAVMSLWKEVVATMPPLRNVALRDTLASIGRIENLYDTRFAAHIVPCDIDYQLSASVSDELQGIDYIQAWLEQLLVEARWMARFDVQSCVVALKRVCPDYKGLHINLYDLLRMSADKLTPLQ